MLTTPIELQPSRLRESHPCSNCEGWLADALKHLAMSFLGKNPLGWESCVPTQGGQTLCSQLVPFLWCQQRDRSAREGSSPPPSEWLWELQTTGQHWDCSSKYPNSWTTSRHHSWPLRNSPHDICLWRCFHPKVEVLLQRKNWTRRITLAQQGMTWASNLSYDNFFQPNAWSPGSGFTVPAGND